MDALKGSGGYRGVDGSMQRSLTFQAIIALLAMPLPVVVGLFGRQEHVRRRRWEVDQEGRTGEIRVEDAEGLERRDTAEEAERVEGRGMI